MVVAIDTLKDALAGIEAVVVDQWGVLHDGSAPCPYAIKALSGIDRRLAIQSISGKPNLSVFRAVEAALGLAPENFQWWAICSNMTAQRLHARRAPCRSSQNHRRRSRRDETR
ncbi:hypothetical protein [Aliiruegeria sabulilitoris]|uniref:hypothetical protein n=1 Tax=Aliiruegeria sabulilitoris TaxID=1510458 RepID=UPI0008347921|nr:hypothetical protein [Aliiruegeria sabulilitoris]NDR58704.1 hypothetical protein [Pseudoruegeria sp. M32A2M]